MSSEDDARELLNAVAGYTDDDAGNGYTPSQDRPPRLATVDPAYNGTGNPKVTFDGELTMSVKTYPYLSTKPAASDRVAMLPIGRGYLLLGKVGVGAWYDALVARVATLESRAWLPVVPTAVASTGSVATFNPVTGVITAPALCTMLRVDGVFAAGYEYRIRSRESDAFTVYTNNMNLRFCTAGTPNSATTHNQGGRWSQYDGTNGQYAINAGNKLAIGPGYTAGGVVHRDIKITDAAEARDTIMQFWAYTVGAARETNGTGSFNGNSQFDGFQFLPDAGTFAITSLSVYRRLALA